MTPAKVSAFPSKRLPVVSVPLTPTQIMVILEALRMARIEVMKAAVTVRGIWPESLTSAEQLACYAEQMADTLAYLDKVLL